MWNWNCIANMARTATQRFLERCWDWGEHGPVWKSHGRPLEGTKARCIRRVVAVQRATSLRAGKGPKHKGGFETAERSIAFSIPKTSGCAAGQPIGEACREWRRLGEGLLPCETAVDAPEAPWKHFGLTNDAPFPPPTRPPHSCNPQKHLRVFAGGDWPSLAIYMATHTHT